MKIRLRFAVGVVAAVALGGTSALAADPYGSASMLPLGQVSAPTATVARLNPQPGEPTVRGNWTGYHEQEEVAPPPANADSAYDAALQDNGWGDSAGSCSDGNCYGDNCSSDGCGGYWFGGVYGLLMARDRENNLGLGYTVVGNQVLHSRDADYGYNPGIETRLGHMCCGCGGATGWEVVYWTIFQNSGFASADAAQLGNTISSDLSMNNLNFGPNNATDYFDNAAYASVRMTNEFHNLELNLLTMPGGCCNYGASRFSYGGGLGIRWFRFSENMLYSSDAVDNIAGNAPDEEAYYNINVTNDLIGVQLAMNANYWVGQNFSLFGETKFGLFGNCIQQSQQIALNDGTIGTINNGPNNGQEWNFNTNKTDVAFLGEVRLGARWQITQRFSAVAAYRAMAVSGVAFTTEQVPVNMGDLQGARNIDSNGSLILHGIQVGGEFRF